VTVFGIITGVKLEHLEKAPSYIEVTELGIVMDIRFEHPENAK
jgi:hypothetical protein